MLNFTKNQPKVISGIFVVDNQRKIVSLNRKFIEIWNINREIIDNRDEQLVLMFVSAYFDDPKKFRENVNDIYKNTTLDSLDNLHLKDGRVLVRYSYPLWMREKYIGRVWEYCELTENNLEVRYAASGVTK